MNKKILIALSLVLVIGAGIYLSTVIDSGEQKGALVKKKPSLNQLNQLSQSSCSSWRFLFGTNSTSGGVYNTYQDFHYALKTNQINCPLNIGFSNYRNTGDQQVYEIICNPSELIIDDNTPGQSVIYCEKNINGEKIRGQIIYSQNSNYFQNVIMERTNQKSNQMDFTLAQVHEVNNAYRY